MRKETERERERERDWQLCLGISYCGYAFINTAIKGKEKEGGMILAVIRREGAVLEKEGKKEVKEEGAKIGKAESKEQSFFKEN